MLKFQKERLRQRKDRSQLSLFIRRDLGTIQLIYRDKNFLAAILVMKT